MSTLSLLTDFYNHLNEKKSPVLTAEQFNDVVKETLDLSPHVADYHDQKQAQAGNKAVLVSPGQRAVGDDEQVLFIRDRMVSWKYRRKEILLLLSCLKELFEQDATNPTSPAETEKQAGDYSGSNALILDELKQIDILSVLLQHVSSKDPFISYESMKTIVYAVRCSSFQGLKDAFIEEVITGVVCSSQRSYLGLLSQLMANRQGETTNAWCYQALRASTLFHQDFLRNILIPGDFSKIESQLPLLSLIQKSVKYVNKLPEQQKHLQEWFPPIERLLLTFLTNCLQKINIKEGRLLCKKVLNIFNTVLQYAGHLAEVKTIPDVYVCTARNVLSVISPSAVLSMPYLCQFVGFGGTEIEATDVKERRGDLALLRKLFTVLIKSCTIVVRSRGPKDKGVSSVSASLDGMTTFLQNTFDENFANLSWLPLIYADQDDAWIEVLLCLLDIYLNSSSDTYRLQEMTSPHTMFLQFLDSSSEDHVMIVDLLTSPETCFLVYFLRYLKSVLNEWNKFVVVCHAHYCSRETTSPHGHGMKKETKPETHSSEPSATFNKCSENLHPLPGLGAYCESESSTGSEDDETVFNNTVQTISGEKSHSDEDLSPHTSTICSSNQACNQKSDCLPLPLGDNVLSCDLQCVEMVLSTFIRVRLRIERLVDQDLFPYNPKPLLALIEQCESLYENTESAMQVT